MALALYPEAMQRPYSAYTDLTPASVAGPPDSPAEQVRLDPRLKCLHILECNRMLMRRIPRIAHR